MPGLAKRSISPHTLRHTTAMHWLRSGVDIGVFALWLGHESPTTTHQQVEADLAMKEKALARLQDPETPVRRLRAADSLLEFLKTLRVCAESDRRVQPHHEEDSASDRPNCS